jgi:hypothetical protein
MQSFSHFDKTPINCVVVTMTKVEKMAYSQCKYNSMIGFGH